MSGNGQYSTALEDRVKRLESKTQDDAAQILAELRDLRALVLDHSRQISSELTRLSGELAKVVTP